jgi:hypothetical protein
MMTIRTVYPILLWLALLPWPIPGTAEVMPIFDVHLHYTSTDAETLPPPAIMALLDAQRIEQAVIIGSPPELAMRLHDKAPQRIVPFLGVYRNPADKIRWPLDEALPGRVEQALKQGQWRGIGELHLFAANRHRPVFHRLIALAGKYQVIMMIHGDPAVIDTLYERAPQQPVIWAHAGTHPYPSLLADYLGRYPRLYIDLSVRNERIAPHGELDDAWRELFEQYPERILLGVDTFSTRRWQRFEQVAATTRHWLAQLPNDIAANLAYRNARQLFAIPE